MKNNTIYLFIIISMITLHACSKDDDSSLPVEDPHEIIFTLPLGSEYSFVSDMVRLEDHLYLVGSKNENKSVMKVDFSGNIIWEREYGAGGLRAVGVNDTDVVFAGYVPDTNSEELLSFGSILQNGNLTQDTSYGKLGVPPVEIIAHQGGISLLYGQADKEFVIKHIDQSGIEQWERKLNIWSLIIKMILTQDGNLLVFGELDQASGEAREKSLTKVNQSNGDIIWQQFYSRTEINSFYYDVIETSDQNIILVGLGGQEAFGDTVSGAEDFILLNDKGEIISKQNINSYRNRHLALAPDGNIIIVGGELFEPSPLSIGKFSSEGGKIWESTYADLYPIALEVDEKENLYVLGRDFDMSYQLIKTSKP